MLRFNFSLVIFLLFINIPLVYGQSVSFFEQTDKNGQERFFFGGLALGMNSSQIDGDTYAGFHKVGINAGVSSFVKLKPKLYANLEILFSQKGAKNVYNYNSPQVGSVPVIYTAKLNYVEIPLMLQYEVQERVFGGVGLSYNRLFSESESIDEVMPNSINRRNPNFKNQDINLLVSAQYQLSGNLFVRARYQYSVASIRAAQQIPIEFGTLAQYNNVFAFQFLLFF